MKWPDHDEPPACSRLHTWLNIQDGRTSNADFAERNDVQSLLHSAYTGLSQARRPLIWLESVDVQAARAAVRLAQTSNATLQVAQSPGAKLTADVTSSDGWLGSTLGEVFSTASLVIHVGQQHLHSAPMFELRFWNPEAQHVYLDTGPDDWLHMQESSIHLHWSKEMWLDGLSRTLLVLRDESAALERRAEALDVAASALAEMLLSSHYTVILWSEDELSDELDGLLVRRLLELARQVSRTARCSLLALPQDAGRVTAKDAVLWLTNHTSPVRYVDNRWTKELLHHHSLQEWQQTFDWILCIRNLPSDRPLPELQFDLVLDAHCNLQSANTSHPARSAQLPVSAVGLDTAGHLLRADHGLAAIVHGVNEERSAYSSAAELLEQLNQKFSDAGVSSAQAEVQ